MQSLGSWLVSYITHDFENHFKAKAVRLLLYNGKKQPFSAEYTEKNYAEEEILVSD